MATTRYFQGSRCAHNSLGLIQTRLGSCVPRRQRCCLISVEQEHPSLPANNAVRMSIFKNRGNTQAFFLHAEHVIGPSFCVRLGPYMWSILCAVYSEADAQRENRLQQKLTDALTASKLLKFKSRATTPAALRLAFCSQELLSGTALRNCFQPLICTQEDNSRRPPVN